MQEAKTRWTHYCIASHFVWISKDRRQMLTGEVQQATKELMAECCQRHDLKLFALETDLDQVHVFVSAPPRLSPAQMANLLKGDRSRSLRLRFPHLKKVCGRDHRLPQADSVATAGAVSAEGIRRSIMQSQGK